MTVVTKKENPEACSTYYVAPLVDTALSVNLTMGAIAFPAAAALSGNADATWLVMETLMILGAIYTGSSALYGYKEVYHCGHSESVPTESEPSSRESGPQNLFRSRNRSIEYQ